MLCHFDAVFAHHPFWSIATIVLARNYDFIPDTMTLYLPFDMRTREAAEYIRDRTEELESLYESQLGIGVAKRTMRQQQVARWEEVTRQEWVRACRENGASNTPSAREFRE